MKHPDLFSDPTILRGRRIGKNLSVPDRASLVFVRRKHRPKDADPRHGDSDFYFELSAADGKTTIEARSFLPQCAADYLELIVLAYPQAKVEFDHGTHEVANLWKQAHTF